MHDQVAKIMGTVGNVFASVTTRGSKGAVATELLDASGNQITSFTALEGLVKVAYDQISITAYDAASNPTTVLYKSAGATVATLTLTYDASSRLTDVTRT